jgi:hypothetical protein
MRGPGVAGAEADPFEEKGVQALRQKLYGLRAVAPVAAGAVTMVFGNKNWKTRVTGTDNAFLAVQDWDLVAGRRFLDSELRAGRAMCSIGTTVRQELFGRRGSIRSRRCVMSRQRPRTWAINSKKQSLAAFRRCFEETWQSEDVVRKYFRISSPRACIDVVFRMPTVARPLGCRIGPR